MKSLIMVLMLLLISVPAYSQDPIEDPITAAECKAQEGYVLKCADPKACTGDDCPLSENYLGDVSDAKRPSVCCKKIFKDGNW